MYDAKKFKNLVHYICWKCSDNPSRLGSVKLNKALWLADLSAYYNTGNSLTGARYVKRQFGPVPRAILPTLQELERDGIIEIRNVRHYQYQKKEFSVKSPPAKFLTDLERKIVDEVIGIVCDQHTATSISELSHDHIWKSAKEGEDIPAFTVFAVPGDITDEEREWARMELEAEIAG